MPLLDHFHLPLSKERHWESFHASWANEIMAALNQGGLPSGYFAETQLSFGGRVEVDVATMTNSGATSSKVDNNGGVAVQTGAATTVLVMPAVFPDEVEVLIFEESGGPSLVGAIELISPGNKDRADARRAFAAKCATYLHSGVGLLMIDAVTTRQANLHDELIQLMGQEDTFKFPFDSLLYCVTYRPIRTELSGDQIEIRPLSLILGQLLPTVSLSLRRGPTILIELEATCTQTRLRCMM